MAGDPTLPIRAGYAVASVPSTDLGNPLARTQRALGSGHDGCARTNAGPLCVATPVRTPSSGRLAAPARTKRRSRRAVARLQWVALARVAGRRGTTPARCPCGSFSDAALPNPAGPFPITGLSSDYVVIVVGCSITENIQDRFGVLHYAYLAALRCSATCAPSPCGRLSRPPRWVVAPTTTMGTPSPWGSRPEG